MFNLSHDSDISFKLFLYRKSSVQPPRAYLISGGFRTFQRGLIRERRLVDKGLILKIN